MAMQFLRNIKNKLKNQKHKRLDVNSIDATHLIDKCLCKLRVFSLIPLAIWIVGGQAESLGVNGWGV